MGKCKNDRGSISESETVPKSNEMLTYPKTYPPKNFINIHLQLFELSNPINAEKRPISSRWKKIEKSILDLGAIRINLEI